MVQNRYHLMYRLNFKWYIQLLQKIPFLGFIILLHNLFSKALVPGQIYKFYKFIVKG